ncbi:MAG: methylated-DNA--[protein]-cysteine S-methyltransferase [Planctomycetota bacterium]|nr:MAG: methylated-DNA--[protein]-cysteine S-methyltransferase [Planctomycetota bacterium]
MRRAQAASAWGPVGVVWSGRGLCCLLLPGEPSAGRRGVLWSAARTARDLAELPPWFSELSVWIAASLAGEARARPELPLDFEPAGSTPFQRAVYAATARIPRGALRSYGEVARAVGRPPSAARAVGGALARNPVPLYVPCHRVVGRRGALTGFSAPGGLGTKRRLLALEGAPSAPERWGGSASGAVGARCSRRAARAGNRSARAARPAPGSSAGSG